MLILREFYQTFLINVLDKYIKDKFNQTIMSFNIGNNLNKAKAYKKVAKNYYDAVSILNSKKFEYI